MIQGLWRTLRNNNESIAQAAFRVLGKLGGSNRKLITEPQRLTYVTGNSLTNYNQDLKELAGPTFKVPFVNYTSNIDISLEKTLSICQTVIRSSSTQDLFYKKHSFRVVTNFLLGLIQRSDSQDQLSNLLSNYQPTNSTQLSQYLIKSQKFSDESLRKLIESALACVFYATNIKEIKPNAMSLLDALTTHLTLISLAYYHAQDEQKLKQLDQFSNISFVKPSSSQGQTIDFMILADTIFAVLSVDDNEYWLMAQRSVILMIEITELVSGYETTNLDDVMRPDFVNLALFDYLAEKACHLCYERSWYAKKAGCMLIKLLSQRMPFVWTLNHSLQFTRSMMFLLVAAVGEISSGAIDIAEENLEGLIRQSFRELPAYQNLAPQKQTFYNELNELQSKYQDEILKELIKQIASSNKYVRHESTKLLTLLGELRSKSLYQLIQPHMDVLNETVAPKKHHKLRHYSIQSQIGIMEALKFCSMQQPQLFTLQPVQTTNPDHWSLYQDLLPLCETEDSSNQNNNGAQNVKSPTAKAELIPLRMAALELLSSFCHLLEQREQILSTLHRALASQNSEIQQCTFKCIRSFISSSENYFNLAKQQPTSTTVNLDSLRPIMQIAADYLREYLHPLTDYKSLNSHVIKHLSYITQLYPTILNEKFSEYLLSHLKKWLDEIVEIIKQENQQFLQQTSAGNFVSVPRAFSQELKVCSLIISLLAELQSAPPKLIESSIILLLKYEKVFSLEMNGQFRLPLSQYLKRYHFDTLKYLLHTDRVKDMYLYRFALYLFKKQPQTFTQVFKSEPNRLVQMLGEANSMYEKGIKMQQLEFLTKAYQVQYLAITIVYRLVKLDPEWIKGQPLLIETLLRLWCSERFHQRYSDLLIEKTTMYANNPAQSPSGPDSHQPPVTKNVLTINTHHYMFIKEPIYLLRIFMAYLKGNLSGGNNIEMLFKLLILYQYKSVEQYEFLGSFEI